MTKPKIKKLVVPSISISMDNLTLNLQDAITRHISNVALDKLTSYRDRKIEKRIEKYIDELAKKIILEKLQEALDNGSIEKIVTNATKEFLVREDLKRKNQI